MFRVPTAALTLALGLAALIGCNSRVPPTDSGTMTGGTGKTPTVEIPPLEAASVEGSGATFVEPIMKTWTEEFLARTNDKVKVNYQGTGSGKGITNLTKKLSDFGCSDAPMNKKQVEEAAAEGGAVVHIPTVIGAVVPVYNLDVAKPLTFNGPVLADIFLGKITKWNDQKLKDLNPDANLPDLNIQPVYRSDPSGTSFIFSDYLCKVSDEAKKTVGASTNPTWPKEVGTAQSKSDGVAGHIGRTPGAIGYIELTYALDSKEKLKYGAVVNKAQKPILANLDSITAAAAASLGVKQTAEPYSLHELTYNLTDAAGEKSYPIAGMSFAVVYQKPPAGPKGKAVVEFLKWITSAEGQELAKRRNYAPLPADLQKEIAKRLDGVQ